MNKRSRPDKLYGRTYKMPTGCGSLYVIINNDDDGKPFELFAEIGKAGGCAPSQTQAIGRMVSLLWRSGLGPDQIIKQLKGIGCHSPVKESTSCADAIAKAIEMHLEIQKGESEELKVKSEDRESE